MKWTRSGWTRDAALKGRNIDEQRAIEDLLGLDRDEGLFMDVDSDQGQGQVPPVCDNQLRQEFVEISNNLQHLSLSHDDQKELGIHFKLTVLISDVRFTNYNGLFGYGTVFCRF